MEITVEVTVDVDDVLEDFEVQDFIDRISNKDMVEALEEEGYTVIAPVGHPAPPEPGSVTHQIETEMYATRNGAVREALRWCLHLVEEA